MENSKEKVRLLIDVNSDVRFRIRVYHCQKTDSYKLKIDYFFSCFLTNRCIFSSRIRMRIISSETLHSWIQMKSRKVLHEMSYRWGNSFINDNWLLYLFICFDISGRRSLLWHSWRTIDYLMYNLCNVDVNV